MTKNSTTTTAASQPDSPVVPPQSAAENIAAAELPIINPDKDNGTFSAKFVAEKMTEFKSGVVLGKSGFKTSPTAAVKTTGTVITKANKILLGIPVDHRDHRTTATGKSGATGKSKIGIFVDPKTLTAEIFVIAQPNVKATVDNTTGMIMIHRDHINTVMTAAAIPPEKYSNYVEYDRTTGKPFATGFTVNGRSSAAADIAAARTEIIGLIAAEYSAALTATALLTANIAAAKDADEIQRLTTELTAANANAAAKLAELQSMTTAVIVQSGDRRMPEYLAAYDKLLVERAAAAAAALTAAEKDAAKNAAADVKNANIAAAVAAKDAAAE